jgi:Tol biopolymer transport system component
MLVTVGGSPAAAQRNTVESMIEIVSVSSRDVQGNEGSVAPNISRDGRLVAFTSDASNLVRGDTNAATDVFVRDRKTGQTTRVSVTTSGTQANDSSFMEGMSPDGRYIVFTSRATNLAATTNGGTNVFLHDRLNHKTTLVSVSSSGVEGNESSYWARISADGRFVVFSSFATNLVSGDTNGWLDVFIRDRLLRTTRLVSATYDRTPANDSSLAPSISADGRYVAFKSFASNLVVGDGNALSDVFLRDMSVGVTRLVSITPTGYAGNGDSAIPTLDDSGRYVVFVSSATDLVSGDTNDSNDVFVRDLTSSTTTRVSVSTEGMQGNGESGGPGYLLSMDISTGGRYVAFSSLASNLVDGDTNEVADVFIRDRVNGVTTRVSMAYDGSEAAAPSTVDGVSISADGRYVCFSSTATNLIASDINGYEDLFVQAAN